MTAPVPLHSRAETRRARGQSTFTAADLRRALREAAALGPQWCVRVTAEGAMEFYQAAAAPPAAGELSDRIRRGRW